MKSLRKRSWLFYLGLSLLILLAVIFVSRKVINSVEKSRVFTFNSESSYWPTKSWQVSTPEEQGMDSAVLSGLFDAIKKPTPTRQIRDKIAEKVFNISTFDFLDIDAVLIVRNGFIVTEAYSNDSGIGQLHRIYSSTKSFTSALFGIAMDKGYISDLDRPVLQFFPDLSPKYMDSRKRSLTIRHLLTMTCGFDWPEWETDYSNSENIVYQLYHSDNWAKFILDKPMAEEPGTTFNYNSGCSQLLATIIHKQTGGDALDFAKKTLFDPLGIIDYEWEIADVSEEPNKKDVFNGTGGLNMKVRDMAKFGYLFLKGGYWENQQIISKHWVEESTKRRIEISGLAGLYLNNYGYQWYIHSFGFHSLGYKGQYIFVIPELEIVAVFISDLQPYQTFDPVGWVEKYIIGAVKSNQVLPDNSEALALLKEKESGL